MYVNDHNNFTSCMRIRIIKPCNWIEQCYFDFVDAKTQGQRLFFQKASCNCATKANQIVTRGPPLPLWDFQSHLWGLVKQYKYKYIFIMFIYICVYKQLTKVYQHLSRFVQLSHCFGLDICCPRIFATGFERWETCTWNRLEITWTVENGWQVHIYLICIYIYVGKERDNFGVKCYWQNVLATSSL